MVTPLPFLTEILGQSYGLVATQVLYFAIAFGVVYMAGRVVLMPLLRRLAKRKGIDEHARRPLIRLVHLLVGFVGVSVAFGFAGLGSFLTSLATVAAAATLAIGFAMQDVMKNLAAGIFIYTDKPFRIGDWIEWNGHSGIVDDISLRVTRVRTFDNELMTVPNSTLTDGVIKNPVAFETLRLTATFGVGYDADIDEATEIILEAAREHPDILDEPEPSVRLSQLEDSSVALTARVWIENPKRSDFVRTKAEYVQTVKERLDDAGIEIPYPYRTLSGNLVVEGLESEDVKDEEKEDEDLENEEPEDEELEDEE